MSHKSLLHVTCLVSNREMMHADADEITMMVKDQLVRALANHIAELILNDPNCLMFDTDHAHQATRYLARIHVLTPAEFNQLMGWRQY